MSTWELGQLGVPQSEKSMLGAASQPEPHYTDIMAIYGSSSCGLCWASCPGCHQVRAGASWHLLAFTTPTAQDCLEPQDPPNRNCTRSYTVDISCPLNLASLIWSTKPYDLPTPTGLLTESPQHPTTKDLPQRLSPRICMARRRRNPPTRPKVRSAAPSPRGNHWRR